MSDDGKDSLFGSPPPSVRGRSPSLALPELPVSRVGAQASSQNVGTIALPGSHEHRSELPVFLNIALPSEKPKALSPRPPATRARARSPAPARAPRTRERVVSTAPRRTPSPPRPPPIVHNPQTDRTLRDLVGLISHFEPGNRAPVQLPPPRPPPVREAPPKKHNRDAGVHAPGTAQNPIEIDEPGPVDAVNSALVALAGTVASALKMPTPPKDIPSLSKPTVNNVLHIIKHDPKLIPVLQATYDYLGSVPTNQPPRSFSHMTTNDPNPPPKRRYIENVVPAGAGHWNVPFPFPPGKGPKDYPSQWQLDRGRRVLGDLLGLFERAFAQARGDKVEPTTTTQNRRPRKRRKTGGVGSSAESARSDFGDSVHGRIDRGSIPSGSKDSSPLDHKRMNEWLSSVPALSASSSIVESTVGLTCPSPSDPVPTSDTLDDLMAMLGPLPEHSSATPVDDKDSSFDFDGAFDDLGADQDDAQWKSLFDFGPTPQSINDITAFPMGFQGDLSPSLSTPQPQSGSTGSHECVIDPVLIALSEPQPTASGSSSSALDGILREKTASTGMDFLSREAPKPFVDQTSISHPESHVRSDLSTSGERDSSQSGQSDPNSCLNVPTTSASSSQTYSRHASTAPTDVYALSVVSSTASSKAERKAAVLAKAKEHRARLVREIEEAKTERWETVIEGGVLMNLQKVGKS